MSDEQIIDTETVDSPPTPTPTEVTEALQRTERALGVAPGSPSAALAAQMVASVQARFLMAERHPRDMVRVRETLLDVCKRPDFAKVARYKKPIGRDRNGEMQYIEGLSVRFAEVMMREMGNILVGEMIVLDDAEKRIIRVGATDLERNIFHDHDVAVKKTVERKKPRDGQRVISARINSAGQEVYEVEGTEDEINIKASANIAKAYRTLVLRFLPPEIKEECDKQIKATVKEEAAKQPEEARKALIEAFAGKGVSEHDLAAYIGHPLDAITLSEIVDLRAIFLALKEGEFSWADVRELVNARTEPVTSPEKSSKAEEVKKIIEKRRADLKKSS